MKDAARLGQTLEPEPKPVVKLTGGMIGISMRGADAPVLKPTQVNKPWTANRTPATSSIDNGRYGQLTIDTRLLIRDDGAPTTGTLVLYDGSESGWITGQSGESHFLNRGVLGGALEGNENVGAALGRKAVASAVLNSAKRTDGLIFYGLLPDNTMLGSKAYWKYYTKETQRKIARGEIDPSDLSSAIKAVADRMKVNIPSGAEEFHTLDGAFNALKTHQQRTRFQLNLGGNPATNGRALFDDRGIISNSDALADWAAFRNTQYGNIAAIGWINIDRPSVSTANEIGALPNAEYPHMLDGGFLLKLPEPIPFEEAFPDYVEEYTCGYIQRHRSLTQYFPRRESVHLLH